jgi:hypothetical protein
MKETPELLAETWQLLVEYIPNKEHKHAAEHLISFLGSILSKEELSALNDLDSDLSDAWDNVGEIEEDYTDKDDEDDNDNY